MKVRDLIVHHLPKVIKIKISGERGFLNDFKSVIYK